MFKSLGIEESLWLSRSGHWPGPMLELHSINLLVWIATTSFAVWNIQWHLRVDCLPEQEKLPALCCCNTIKTLFVNAREAFESTRKPWRRPLLGRLWRLIALNALWKHTEALDWVISKISQFHIWFWWLLKEKTLGKLQICKKWIWWWLRLGPLFYTDYMTEHLDALEKQQTSEWQSLGLY